MKNTTVIIIVVAGLLIAVYFFVFKKPKSIAPVVTTSPATTPPVTPSSDSGANSVMLPAAPVVVSTVTDNQVSPALMVAPTPVTGGMSVVAPPAITQSTITLDASKFNSSSGVNLYSSPQPDGTMISAIAPSAWMQYDKVPLAQGNYTIDFMVASPNNTGSSFSAVLNGPVIASIGMIQVPFTQAWSNFQKVSSKFTIPVNGAYDLRLSTGAGKFNIKSITITPVS